MTHLPKDLQHLTFRAGKLPDVSDVVLESKRGCLQLQDASAVIHKTLVMQAIQRLSQYRIRAVAMMWAVHVEIRELRRNENSGRNALDDIPSGFEIVTKKLKLTH